MDRQGKSTRQNQLQETASWSLEGIRYHTGRFWKARTTLKNEKLLITKVWINFTNGQKCRTLYVYLCLQVKNMLLRSLDWMSNIYFSKMCGFIFLNLGKPLYFLKFSVSSFFLKCRVC